MNHVEKFNTAKGNPSWIVCEKTIFVGIDVGKEFNKAKALIEKQDRHSSVVVFNNRRKGFEKLVGKIEQWKKRYDCENVRIAMEPTAGYWKPLFHFLRTKGFDVKLVRSLNVKQHKEMKDNSKLKTDEKDALVIADLLFTGNSFDYVTYQPEFERLKILWNLFLDVEKSRNQWVNRLEYFKSKIMPELDDVFSDPFCKTSRELLAKYPFPEKMIRAGKKKLTTLLVKSSKGYKGEKDAVRLLQLAKETVGEPQPSQVRDAEKTAITTILKNVAHFENEKKAIEKQLETTLKSIPFYHLIESIEGFGVKTAAGLLQALGDVRQYSHSRQLIKKVGLNLYRLSSGKKTGVDKISHRGSPSARQALFMAALAHTHKGAAFYDKYNSMVKRGVKKMKAVTAIMRHILEVIFALVRDNRKFSNRGA